MSLVVYSRQNACDDFWSKPNEHSYFCNPAIHCNVLLPLDYNTFLFEQMVPLSISSGGSVSKQLMLYLSSLLSIGTPKLGPVLKLKSLLADEGAQS